MKEILEGIDWPLIIDQIATKATCELGRSQIKLLKPLANQKLALSSIETVMEAQLILQSGVRPFFESVDFFATWHPRLAKGATLKNLELKDVRHFCAEAIALKELILPLKGSWFDGLNSLVLDCEEPLSAIDQLLTPSGDIKSDASETLYKLFQEQTRIGREIHVHLDKLVKQHDLENVLQDKYVTTREGRWVLPIRSGMQSRFEGIIHASSQSKQTVFMEPQEVVNQNNRLRQVEVEIEDEIERLLKELSNYLHNISSQLEETKIAMVDCDIRLAQAQFCEFIGASAPEFTDNEIELQELKHPLLVLKNQPVVANTVRLDLEERLLLLSGPNAGGKTVLLKSIGLAAQMARCGLPICASHSSKIPFFDDITIGVGDAQNVNMELSTFAAHLSVLNLSTKKQGSKNLILIDEICGSTDPEEGSALARSFIEVFSKNKVFAVVTSHLGPLKSGWDAKSGVLHGSLEYNNQTGMPTYQLILGIPGQSQAIQTARRVGVENHIVERALECLSPEKKAYIEKMDSLESLKDELDMMKSKLQREFRQNQKIKSKYEALILSFQKEKEKLLEKELKKAESKVEQLIGFAKADTVFKKHESLQKVKNQLPEVIKPQSSNNNSFSITNSEDFAKRFPPGSKVFIPSIGRDAFVQGVPNQKGEVPVLSQSMRLSVHWESIKFPQNATNPTSEVLKRKTGIAFPEQDGDRVVDLRGLNVDEAIEQLERQLDTASFNKESRVKVIHGHGTDTLKRAIRGYLSRSVYVKKWNAGTASTGGDGITWIELN